MILTWIPQGWVEGYEILEGTLRNNKCGEYRTGGLPFNPSGYNNDPNCQNICLENVRYDHFRKCYWKDINNNCCSWLDQNGKCCDNEICYGTEPLKITGPPVKLYPTEEDDRYFLVIPYCHRADEGSSAKNYSNVERPAPVCQKGYGSSNKIDCYHWYFGEWQQDYDYGRMHWP